MQSPRPPSELRERGADRGVDVTASGVRLPPGLEHLPDLVHSNPTRTERHKELVDPRIDNVRRHTKR